MKAPLKAAAALAAGVLLVLSLVLLHTERGLNETMPVPAALSAGDLPAIVEDVLGREMSELSLTPGHMPELALDNALDLKSVELDLLAPSRGGKYTRYQLRIFNGELSAVDCGDYRAETVTPAGPVIDSLAALPFESFETLGVPEGGAYLVTAPGALYGHETAARMAVDGRAVSYAPDGWEPAAAISWIVQPMSDGHGTGGDARLFICG